MKTADAARGKWRGILTGFGIPENAMDGKHHPCPCTGAGIDRFRFSDTGGDGRYFCQCAPMSGTGFDLLSCKLGLRFEDVARQVDDMIGNKLHGSERMEMTEEMKKRKDNLHRLVKLSKDCVPIGVSGWSGIAVDYFLSRKIDCRDLPPTSEIMHANSVPYYDENGKMLGRYPAIVTRVTGALGKPVTLHVTYLDDSGTSPRKFEPKGGGPSRKMLPPAKPMKGAAAKLHAPVDGNLGIGEGLESTLSASLLFGGLPVWAALTAGMMETMDIDCIADVNDLYIFADNDKNFHGQASAYKLANRIVARHEHVRVHVKIPDKCGDDWNDVLVRTYSVTE